MNTCSGLPHSPQKKVIKKLDIGNDDFIKKLDIGNDDFIKKSLILAWHFQMKGNFFFDFATFDVAAKYEKQFCYNLSLYLSCEKL